MLDLTERIDSQQLDEAKRRKLATYEREHGGLIPSDRERDAKSRSVAGWGPYRPSITPSEAKLARAGLPLEDLHRVTLQRLYVDCGAAVRRFAPKHRRARAETLRNDALLLLIDWPSHGRERSIDLGGRGGTPLRREWLERTESDGRTPTYKLTPLAWRALHAAVKQAAESPAMKQLEAIEAAETPTDALDIAAAVEAQQRESDAATRLPDNAAPEVIAHALDLTLDAGRAIVARAYPAATLRDLAEAWRITEQATKNALSRGASAVRERFPDPSDLLDALDSAAAAWRAETEQRAILGLIDYRDGRGDESDALDAVAMWRGASAGLSESQRVLLAAAREALQRNVKRNGGTGYGSERAERIARSIPRLMTAEASRALRVANTR